MSSDDQRQFLPLRYAFCRDFRLHYTADALQESTPMRVDPAAFNPLTGKTIEAAIEVHRNLGPGLLESIYAPCLHYELAARNLRYVSQRLIPISYKSLKLEGTYRVDLIVEDLVVVEIKSVSTMTPVFDAQVLTYLHLTECPIALLINFNVPRLIDGVKRLLNARTSEWRM